MSVSRSLCCSLNPFPLCIQPLRIHHNNCLLLSQVYTNMDLWKHASSSGVFSISKAPMNAVREVVQLEEKDRVTSQIAETNVDIDFREIYFLIMHFLSSGPCQNTSKLFWNELLEHQLLPRRYHAWFSRSGAHSGHDDDDGISFPLGYNKLVERYPHIEKDHLVKLLRQLIMHKALSGKIGGNTPNAADVPTLLGSGSFSLLECDRNVEYKQAKHLPAYLRWPHMQADQVRGLSLREIGGGFTKHHRAPSIRSACYAICKPSTMVQKMQNIKKSRGHRDAVYCAIFDRSGRYVITGSDDRLVKIWSMETAFCLASCRGHEGDITDLAVSSNNALVASASNDFVIRVWRLPDGLPISVLRGHTGAVTAIAFSPRPSAVYQLLSSSDDGTCRIWDARYSQCSPRIYLPKPSDASTGKGNPLSSGGPSSSTAPHNHQILCCAYNANGTVFVTGSSDTFARVWSACKSNTDETDLPIHELDVLSGHENDVNYVQFSGCAVASKSSMLDALKEENVPKFKNSWFCHDNIVTCSRDGSAIIWIPRSRRSHGKVGRWTRAYHLKVPPPPLPPQPPRGGPRQRLLPTPRGVNMIVWSLDNRFVLAAIMDCRICVWNAVDGSLVHSLTGHTASSYVLDVHPFNPRIAMSAGYDGRTIVWDIWEGTPVRIYEIGRFKLVDGKFSPDGTSIVLSDDVGQIYLLNTGQGESQKDAKYDQFFLGDYRPLIRDNNGNVLDQETQLVPHRRNMQDPLCDSSMIPYDEPYQSMYQRRRLGALGVEWHPSSINLAVGPDFSLGQDYSMPPLEDLERMMEPVPEFIDAVYWEPENEVISDDNDSEYNVAEECSSEGEQGSLCSNSFSDPDCSAEDSEVDHSHKDGLRRSRRKKHKNGVELKTSSGRRVKKRNLDDRDASASRSNRTKKLKTGQKVLKRKSSKAKSLRPQRVAARNARSMFSRDTATSTGEDDSELEYDSSDSDLVLQYSNIESEELDGFTQDMRQKGRKEEDEAAVESGYTTKPVEPSGSQSTLGNRKKLVLKFSCKRPVSLDATSTGSALGTTGKWKTDISLTDPSSSSPAESGRQSENHIDEPAGDEDNKIRWGEVRIRTSKLSNSGVELLTASPHEHDSSLDDHKGIRSDAHGAEDKFASDASLNVDIKNQELLPLEDKNISEHRTKGDASISYSNNDRICPHETEEELPPKVPRVRIKTKKIAKDPNNPSVLKFMTVVEDPANAESDLLSENALDVERDIISGVPEVCKDNSTDTINHKVSRSDSSEGAALELHQTRSKKMKGTSLQPYTGNGSLKLRFGSEVVGTSKSVGSSSSMKAHDELLSEEWIPSNTTVRPRSTRNRQRANHDEDPRLLTRRRSNFPVRKLSWLMLSEHEEGYRYIPQLGDEVVYLRQGHQEFIELNASREVGPWRSVKGYVNAVEICKVESLVYATCPGSGDSCCKMTLKFTDPSSAAFGKSFKLTLPELINFPDFIIERTRYDAAVSRNWTHRDKCWVWWKNENQEGGFWWEGRIISSQAKSPEFPDSPWERYVVRYKTAENHTHSPWELHDLDIPWEHPHIDSDIRDKLLSYFDKLERPLSRHQDYYGIHRLNEAAQKLDFFNRFPVPLYPEVIRLRLENNYYRSFEAVKDDIKVMLSNAESYFVKNVELLTKVRRLCDWFTRKLSKL